jgi:hypothetical protein
MTVDTVDGPTWRNRIVGSEDVDPTQLVANPDNWRLHPGRQRDALRGSLSEIGWIARVVVNRTTGNVVDGHARIEEAISRGEPTVPVEYVELSLEEEKLALATFDPIGAMATRDDAKLRDLLGDLSVSEAGLHALLESLASNVNVEAPSLFPDPENGGSGIVVSYRCPRCSYEWSGSAKPNDGSD